MSQLRERLGIRKATRVWQPVQNWPKGPPSCDRVGPPWWDLRTRFPGTGRTRVPGGPPRQVLSCATATYGILSVRLERRSGREGALLIAGSEREEEVAEIKRSKEREEVEQQGRARSRRVAHWHSRRLGPGDPAVLWGTRRCPSLLGPSSVLSRSSPLMASPDDPLRSGKVTRCRGLPWTVTANWGS